ncbi:MAG: hypothetical protein C4290_06315 [Chloroflexota bacterium]
MLRVTKPLQRFSPTRSAATPPAAVPTVPPRAGSLAERWRPLGRGELADSVRRICTLCGWSQAPVGRGRSLAVTSALRREGKTALATAIAIATASDHSSEVLLLECDLVNPTLNGDFALEPGPGLTEVLSGAAPVEQALHRTALPNLRVLPAGGHHDNPSRLLRSSTMTALMEEIHERFAFTVLDLPAVLENADAPVLAHLADGAVLVVRAGHTDQRAVQQAAQLLTGATLHGVVLNRWRPALPDFVRRALGG